jgi:arginyl-tRNA--protein-N-Asp/Glu arginylyltransferase
MSYLNWNTKTVSNPTLKEIDALYADGYVATRIDTGIFNQTRSFRVPLTDFTPSSENRRVVRKLGEATLEAFTLPYEHYHWSIHKLAKDFYEKFGENVFSANKVKELLTEKEKSNFNTLLVFKDSTGVPFGYCIGLKTETLFHYSYPFYKEDPANSSRGLGMMNKALLWAQEQGLTYLYLGSLQRPSDVYKLQFEGQEWFDGTAWTTDITPLREILK